jgi:hypothetical protein
MPPSSLRPMSPLLELPPPPPEEDHQLAARTCKAEPARPLLTTRAAKTEREASVSRREDPRLLSHSHIIDMDMLR